MGGSKSPDVPAAPTYQQNPALQSNIDWGTGFGKQMASLDFTGQLANLSPLIQNDPEVTKLAMQYAQQSLTPAWNDTMRSIKNEAANAGALESSTFTDALTQSGQDLNSNFQSIVTSAALEDRNRALTNMKDLSSQGVNTVGQFTSLAGQQEQMQNNFNLQNYQNQLAAMQLSQKSSSAGGWGALGGMALGALLAAPTNGMSLAAGAMLGGSVGGIAGGLMGGGSTGGTAVQSGLTGLGIGFGSGLFNSNTGQTTPVSTAAGMTAGNNLFGSSMNMNNTMTGSRWLSMGG